MRPKRLVLDLGLLAALVVGGVAAYPWGRQQYYLWLLDSPNPEQAREARSALTRLGPAVVPALSEVVRTGTSPGKRLLAFEALTKIEDPRVVPLMLDVASEDWDQELQSLSLQLLGHGGIREARPTFRRLLSHADARVRYDALRGLIAAGDAAVVPTLVDRLEDDDYWVASTAATALGRFAGQPRPFPEGDAPEARTVRAATIQAWREWYAAGSERDSPRLAVAHHGPDAERPVVVAKPPAATEFALPALDGSVVRLSGFRGKPVLINFWATWCTPCIEETADLVETARELGEEAIIVGVAAEYKNEEPAIRDLQERGVPVTEQAITELQTAAVHQFVAAHGVSYPVVFGDAATLDAYYAYALPTTVIVRPDGVIHRRLIGPRGKAYFLAALRAAAQ